MDQSPVLAKSEEPVNLLDVLKDLPALRSGLSSGGDTGSAWLSEIRYQRRRLIGMLGRDAMDLRNRLRHLNFDRSLERSSSSYTNQRLSPRHNQYFRDPQLNYVLNHETRGHMNDDLGRYLFTSLYAEERERSPVSSEFPLGLYPDHKSWSLGQFADRFRVQLPTRPASTITSHLSKDGHAFIHWDPEQCRSLTVREAARAQTFPDNYLFLGGRTQQYVQVGNAVPPLLAQRIAEVVWSLLENRRKY
jgi:DNA (cytosine-5)-methyltransferase 1